jgi:cobalt-zinc-cadmium resistance protein CzcA
VAIALLASLMLSIFVIPALCALVLRPGQEGESLVMRWGRRVYRPVLVWTLRKRYLVISGALVALMAAVLVLTRLGTEFIPIMDEGAFDMDVQLLPGISLSKALDTTKLVEKKLRQFPELTTIISRTGQTGSARSGKRRRTGKN